MTEIKSIIFDLGKVIFDLSFDRVFQSWATSSGRQFADIKNKFAFDNIFYEFERNDISPTQFRTAILQRLDITLSDKEFDNGWCNLYLDTYKDIDNFLIDLKSNYRLIALTNTNVIHNDTWRARYADTLLHFEKIFSSHELKTRKPESKIYEIVLDYLKLKPEQTIFLDDNEENINGAKKLGILTILVTSNEQMKVDLNKYLLTK